MPAFGILFGKASIWKDHQMTQQDWENKFVSKIEVSRYTKPYLEFVIKSQKNFPELFVK
jgi:hypothetical protein